MPWSLALPQAIFASPLLSTLTPIATGSAVGYLVNRHGTTPKYNTLVQPPLSPPAWLFPPVWTLLYGIMGFAAHHASTKIPRGPALSTTQTLYTTQLLLNHLWMPLFFSLRKPALAAADILLLGGNVLALMRSWWDTDPLAFWLMVPYGAWLGYATYLNLGVGVLNNWRIPEPGEKGKGE
ncbi:TspO/MBR-related protein [Aspergillus egyptiacus]|nr:TspO/MBR-related protein [Aspergillus egyptiacus]